MTNPKEGDVVIRRGVECTVVSSLRPGSCLGCHTYHHMMTVNDLDRDKHCDMAAPEDRHLGEWTCGRNHIFLAPDRRTWYMLQRLDGNNA